MQLKKLMIFANLTYVQRNLENLAKWIEKDWCHGKERGKGKQVANASLWKKIVHEMKLYDIQWMWNPNGLTFRDVRKRASSNALFPSEKQP